MTYAIKPANGNVQILEKGEVMLEQPWKDFVGNVQNGTELTGGVTYEGLLQDWATPEKEGLREVRRTKLRGAIPDELYERLFPTKQQKEKQGGGLRGWIYQHPVMATAGALVLPVMVAITTIGTLKKEATSDALNLPLEQRIMRDANIMEVLEEHPNPLSEKALRQRFQKYLGEVDVNALSPEVKEDFINLRSSYGTNVQQ